MGAAKNVAQLKRDHPDYHTAIQSEGTTIIKAILRAGTTSDAIEFMLRNPEINEGAETLLSTTLEFFRNISG